MSTARVKKYNIRWQKLWGRFVFWFLCIPVNIIPIGLKHAKNLTPATFQGIKNLVMMTLGDFEFSFISLSVVFVLCIEGFFAEEELVKVYHMFQLGAIFYGFFLLILYMYFFLKPEMFSLMGMFSLYGINGDIIYNLTLIFLTIVLGFFCNATISIERSEN